MSKSIKQITDIITDFSDKRGWTNEDPNELIVSAMIELGELAEHYQWKKEFPKFKAGDNVTVNYKIIEGNKERIQSFRGDVIKLQGQGSTATFTVRKISDGVGVERLFPFFSPNIESIVLNKAGRVRRAKLFYQRERFGKSARIQEKKRAVETA